LAAETEALVAANWPAILRVAEALLERPLLSEADLDRLIAGGALASPPFVLKQGGAEWQVDPQAGVRLHVLQDRIGQSVEQMFQ
jgi:hypothetical protein